MLREKKKKFATVVANNRDDTKSEKNGRTGGTNIKYELSSESKKKKKQQLQQEQESQQNSKQNVKRSSEMIFKIPEKNQLHPDSVFQHDRRNSFSTYTVQQRRASYDRYHVAENASEFTNGPERRASYDVSYLHTSTLQPSDDVKTSRRGSIVQRWFKRISDAAEAHKQKEGKPRNNRSSDVSNNSTQDLDSCANGSESSAKTKENESGNTGSESVNNRQPQDEATGAGLGAESAAKKPGSGGIGGTSPGLRKKRITATEPPRLTTEGPLIEPSQVLISERAVLTAEPVLTPLERLRRKDETIREALLEKQKLVADILHVPKEEFDTIADLAAEPTYDKEASELVLAAVNQADQLTSLLNECLRVTEEDAIAAGCEVNLSNASAGATTRTSSGHSGSGGVGSSVRAFPGVPVSKLRPIAQSLSSHLTVLLTLMTERDEERERLRQELQKSREQLHAMYETQQRMQRINDQTLSPNEAAQNAASENVTEDGNKMCP